jgi:hypothetical protein
MKDKQAAIEINVSWLNNGHQAFILMRRLGLRWDKYGVLHKLSHRIWVICETKPKTQ